MPGRNGADLEPATAYDLVALRADVEHDRELLLAFAAEIASVDQKDDPKLQALATELAAIAAQAEEEGIGVDDTRDKRKVLVFTYFADTVDWIAEYLERGVNVRRPGNRQPTRTDFSDPRFQFGSEPRRTFRLAVAHCSGTGTRKGRSPSLTHPAPAALDIPIPIGHSQKIRHSVLLIR